MSWILTIPSLARRSGASLSHRYWPGASVIFTRIHFQEGYRGVHPWLPVHHRDDAEFVVQTVFIIKSGRLVAGFSEITAEIQLSKISEELQFSDISGKHSLQTFYFGL
jgi:hypothetical protein